MISFIYLFVLFLDGFILQVKAFNGENVLLLKVVKHFWVISGHECCSSVHACGGSILLKMNFIAICGRYFDVHNNTTDFYSYLTGDN